MAEIAQIIEMIVNFFQANTIGWNFTAAFGALVTFGVAAKFLPPVIAKLVHGSFSKYYASRLARYEEKIRSFIRDKNSEKLDVYLVKRENLRIKAAKRNVVIGREVGLDHITKSQSKLSKHDRQTIIRDAEYNKLIIKGQVRKAAKKAEKWGIAAKIRMQENSADSFSFVETLPAKDRDIKLWSNSIQAVNKEIVKNYESDVTGHKANKNFQARQGGFFNLSKVNDPLVFEITNDKNETIYKLSDISPERFFNYTFEGFSYLDHLLQQNLNLTKAESKSYTVNFYDTAKGVLSGKQLKPILASISSSEQLYDLIRDYDWEMGPIKQSQRSKVEDTNNEVIYDLVKKVKEKSKFYDFNQKDGVKTKVNSFVYPVNSSIRSKALEVGLASVIEKTRMIEADSEPKITKLLFDGKEVFKLSVESNDMFKATDSIVDAYIAAILAKRLLVGLGPGNIVKSVAGYEVKGNEVNKNIALNKKFISKDTPVSDIAALFAENKNSKDFVPAFLGVAKELELPISVEFLRTNNIFVGQEYEQLIKKHLSVFVENEKEEALRRFGLISSKQKEKSEVTYQNIKDQPDEFENASHYQEASAVKMPKQSITTTLKNVRNKFYEDINERPSNLKGIPHTADIICEDDKKTKILFKLGITMYDDKKFKEYLYKILLESVYLVEKQDRGSESEPIDLFITFTGNKERYHGKFKSIFELKDQVEKMKEDYGFDMDLSDFKKIFGEDADGKGM